MKRIILSLFFAKSIKAVSRKRRKKMIWYHNALREVNAAKTYDEKDLLLMKILKKQSPFDPLRYQVLLIKKDLLTKKIDGQITDAVNESPLEKLDKLESFYKKAPTKELRQKAAEQIQDSLKNGMNLQKYYHLKIYTKGYAKKIHVSCP